MTTRDSRPKLRLIEGGKGDATKDKFLLRKPIYQLRILLVDIEPEIWRRVLVSGNISLGKLHDLVQICMGWEDYHLHLFQTDDNRTFTSANSFQELGAEDERRVKLRKIAPEVGSAFAYQYDFGDDWIHRVIVEDIIDPREAGRVPRCLDGQRACPPEDVGGPFRYGDYLQAIGDRQHPEHRELLEWRGLFDAEAFDLQHVNELLRKAFPRG